jgi:hypothetical protein
VFVRGPEIAQALVIVVGVDGRCIKLCLAPN